MDNLNRVVGGSNMVHRMVADFGDNYLVPVKFGWKSEGARM